MEKENILEKLRKLDMRKNTIALGYRMADRNCGWGLSMCCDRCIHTYLLFNTLIHCPNMVKKLSMYVGQT